MDNFLFVTHTFSPKVGGMEQYYAKLTRHFRDKITVIAPVYNSKCYSADKDMPIYRGKIICQKPEHKLARYLVTLQERVHTVVPAMYFIFKKRIKLLVLGSIWLSWLGYFLKKYLSLKYVVFAHGTDLLGLKNDNLSEKLISKQIKYLNNANKVIANSTFTKQLAKDCGVKEDILEIVYPGCDLQEELISIDNLKHAKTKAGPILLGVGRLVKRKGFELVIEVLPEILKRYPHLKYFIVGEGEQRKILEEFVAKNKLHNNVIFKGRISGDELNELYQSCDIFVLINYIDKKTSDVEGFGMVFLEANSFAKPVIGGNSGGATDAIIDEETGFLVNPDDKNEIKEKLLYLLDNPEVAKQIGRKGLERVRSKFSWNVTFSKLEQIFSSDVN